MKLKTTSDFVNKVLFLILLFSCSYCFAMANEGECVNGGELYGDACRCPNGFSSTEEYPGCTVPPCYHPVTENNSAYQHYNQSSRTSECKCRSKWDGVMCQLCESDASCIPEDSLQKNTRSYRCDKSYVIYGKSKHFECAVVFEDVSDVIGDTVTIQCDKREGSEQMGCHLQTWLSYSSFVHEQVIYCDLDNCTTVIESVSRKIVYQCESSNCGCINGSALCDQNTQKIAHNMRERSTITCDQNTMECEIKHTNFPGKIELQCIGSECIRNDTEVPVIPVRKYVVSAIEFLVNYTAYIFVVLITSTATILLFFLLIQSCSHYVSIKAEYSAIQNRVLKIESLNCEQLNYYIDKRTALKEDFKYREQRERSLWRIWDVVNCFSQLFLYRKSIFSTRKGKWSGFGYSKVKSERELIDIGDVPKNSEDQGENKQSTRASVKKKRKHILKNVSLNIVEGCMTAVMGASGEGKSTLMDIMMNKEKSGITTGKVAFGSSPVSFLVNRIAGYAYQTAKPCSYLTVREALEFALEMKVGNCMTRYQKEKRVNEVLERTGLSHKQSTLVGTPSSGISGGEAKRLVIACELVSYPMILFLDEPTSGVDTVLAEDLIEYLKSLCKTRSMTIVITIHQPSERIFSFIDRIVLFKEGKMVFHGCPIKCAQHMSQYRRSDMPQNCSDNRGHYISHCLENYPRRINISKSKEDDNALDIESEETYNALHKYANPNFCATDEETMDVETNETEVDYDTEEYGVVIGASRNSVCYNRDGDLEEGSTVYIAGNRTFDEISLDEQCREIRLENMNLYATSHLHQLRILTRRSIIQCFRDKMLLFTNSLISLCSGLAIGLLFYGLGDDIAGTQSRMGGIFFICLLLCFGATSSIGSFVKESECCSREQSSGYYSPSMYYLSKAIVDVLIIRTLPCVCMVTIAYFMIGLRAGFAYYAWFALVTVLFNCTSGALCMLVSVLCSGSEVSTANSLASFIILFNSVFAGVFLNPSSIPKYLRWLKYTSYWSYTFESLMSNELHNRIVYFNPKGLPAYKARGDLYLRELYQRPELIYVDAMIVCGFLIFIHSVASALSGRCMRERK